MKSNKGMELPINTLIILTIAIVVLLALVIFFSGSFTPARGAVEGQSGTRSACAQYAANGCCTTPTGSGCAGVDKLPSDLKTCCVGVG